VAELIKAGGKTISPAIHKRINSIWNKEELPEEWKESIIVPICKKGNETDCGKYRGTSYLSIMNKTLSSILLSMLTPHAEEIIGDNQHGLRCDRATTDHIFCIKYLREKMGIQRTSASATYRIQESL